AAPAAGSPDAGGVAHAHHRQRALPARGRPVRRSGRQLQRGGHGRVRPRARPRAARTPAGGLTARRDRAVPALGGAGARRPVFSNELGVALEYGCSAGGFRSARVRTTRPRPIPIAERADPPPDPALAPRGRRTAPWLRRRPGLP